MGGCAETKVDPHRSCAFALSADDCPPRRADSSVPCWTNHESAPPVNGRPESLLRLRSVSHPDPAEFCALHSRIECRGCARQGYRIPWERESILLAHSHTVLYRLKRGSGTPLTLSLLSWKSTFSQPFKEKCISEVATIGSVIIFHLNKLWKAKFSILCDVIILVNLQGKFDINRSCEWKG